MNKVIVFLITCLFTFSSYSLFSQTDDPKQFVKDWVEAHPGVKTISQLMYNRYTPAIKAEFNALAKKIVYQTYLTKEDILQYEKAHATIESTTNQHKQ